MRFARLTYPQMCQNLNVDVLKPYTRTYEVATITSAKSGDMDMAAELQSEMQEAELMPCIIDYNAVTIHREKSRDMDKAAR